MKAEQDWDIIVKPKSSLFKLDLQELWAYRDLIALLIKRDIVALYKQTILGPVWMFIQPIFSTLVYTFTFSQANLSTDGIPALLFYLTGQTFWSYFSECFNKTSNTFIANAAVFGKVYFPRLVVPISVVLSNLLRLAIQLLLLGSVYLYYYFTSGGFAPQLAALLFIPLCVLVLGSFSLSLGVLFSSVTTKYRDFSFLLAFAIQLLMFLSCIVFPASMFSPKIRDLLMYNPVATSLETIRFALTGHGYFSMYYILVSLVVSVLTLLFSILVFNRTEKTFMDTV